MTKSAEIVEKVSREIVETIERGGFKEFTKTWKSAMPNNIISKVDYRGMNILLCWAGGALFPTQEWATFKQVQAAGGSVKKGSKGNPIVRFVPFPDQEGVEKKRGFMKVFSVFNVEQTTFAREDLDQFKKGMALPNVDDCISAYLEREDLKLQYGNPAYSPTLDHILMPPRADFAAASFYYSTFFHELAHSTGAKKRLNRVYGKKFGDEDYAFEELVAELTAAFLCAKFDLDFEDQQHTGYVAHWLKKAYSQDKSVIYKAASKASAAMHMILAEAKPD